MATDWRLILSGPTDPCFNMGLDEAMLLTRTEPPTLRFYQWNKPCLSLGYFQKADDFIPGDTRARGFTLTRRITGGGAIAHHNELTYSITCDATHPLVAGDIRASYERLHAPWIEFFRGAGARYVSGPTPGRAPEIAMRGCGTLPDEDGENSKESLYCFRRLAPFDVTWNGIKFIGSAQRRTQGRFLQHGSIILAPSGLPDGTENLHTGCRPGDEADLARALAAAFAAHFQLTMHEGKPTMQEHGIGYTLGDTKYSTELWLRRR